MKIVKVNMRFKLQDFWIGVFWKSYSNWPTKEFKFIDIWICLVPCFPLHVKLYKNNSKIPRWRRIRRFITKRLFGYVNINDFGAFEGDEDVTKELQNAIDYCRTTKRSGIWNWIKERKND